jgi:hypothetical protein
MNLLNVGGSMTGGTTVVLSPAGLSAGGKASFTAPNHTRLEPEVIDFLVTPVKATSASDPGVARSGLKIAFANRVESEGCCGVQAGTVIFDVGMRWPLSQPEAVLDSAIQYLQALVFSTAFVDALKKGVLPTG